MENHQNFMRRGCEWSDVGFLYKWQRKPSETKYPRPDLNTMYTTKPNELAAHVCLLLLLLLPRTHGGQEEQWNGPPTTANNSIPNTSSFDLPHWEDTYRPTVWSNGLGRCIGAIVQLQVVVLATSRVIDENLGKGDGHEQTSGCCDAPFTVATIGIGPWEVGACKGAMVSVESAATT